MQFTVRSLAVLFCLQLLACGSDESSSSSPTSIGCEWFTGQNCWKDVGVAATSCVDQTAQGTFSADGRQCTYADGTVVTLARPLAEIGGDVPWDITVTKNGTECIHYREEVAGVTVETTLGTFSEGPWGTKLLITCPDGAEYAMEGIAFVECGLAAPDSFPGHSGSSGSTGAAFELDGMTPAVKLMDCVVP